MGRGRAKAKQQKVARELKYNVHETDFTALQRELGAGGEPQSSASDDEDFEDDYDDADGWASAR
jgi:hypothetical protein